MSGLLISAMITVTIYTIQPMLPGISYAIQRASEIFVSYIFIAYRFLHHHQQANKHPKVADADPSGGQRISER